VKQISLPSHVFMEHTGPQPVNVQAAIAQTAEAHENRKSVILCGLLVEREIEAIIGFYLYPGPIVTEQQAFFAGEILGSDAVTFAHKKRLILTLVNKCGWLKGEAKNAFDAELKKVISLRNAFTHGNIVVGDSAAFLEYFEASRRKIELTDAYWSDVEASFNAVVERISAIKQAAGMPRTDGDGAA
jgi:hypothetical protein